MAALAATAAGQTGNWPERLEWFRDQGFARKFHPQDWAVLAKLAGVRYVVFTAKHHSG